jgi:CheY-like chemotaxis protein
MKLNEKLLTVDDDGDLRSVMCELMQREGISCVSAVNGIEAIVKLREGHFFAVLTDFKMPGMTGLELTNKIRETHPLLPVILMTGFGEKSLVVGALKAGVTDYLDKPF